MLINSDNFSILVSRSRTLSRESFEALCEIYHCPIVLQPYLDVNNGRFSIQRIKINGLISGLISLNAKVQKPTPNI
ncbi:hypothetical protein ACA081_00940 [Candidatus Hodgkinia cicadicola]